MFLTNLKIFTLIIDYTNILPTPISVLSPENKVRISAGLAGVHLISSILLGQGHLHELGCVQSEGEDGDRDDVDQESLGVAHSLQS